MEGMVVVQASLRNIISVEKKPGPKAGKNWLWDVYKVLHKAVMFGI